MLDQTTTMEGGVTAFQIKVNGKPLSKEVTIYSIEVENQVNRVPSCLIKINDAHASHGSLDYKLSKTFSSGVAVAIIAKLGNKDHTIFDGIVTGQRFKINNEIGSALEVLCRGKAIDLTIGRRNKTYAKKVDSEIISTIIDSVKGLQADVASTVTQREEQVQYDSTDWDFIISLARANGLIVTTDLGKVTVAKPKIKISSVLTAKFGDNILDFDGELNAIDELSNEETNSYSRIRGQVTIEGTSSVSPGNYISLEGIGDEFNKDVIVSRVLHQISEGNWITQISLGLTSNQFPGKADVMIPSAANSMPGVGGLFAGTVKKVDEDPDGQYRILVDIPLFDPEGNGIWARLSNFYATNGAGAFFLPEVGDEVVLGMLNQDPQFPIILGSLYSKSNRPFDQLNPTNENSRKAIVSNKKMYVEFDDEDVVFTIMTPNKNQMVFSDKDKQIRIQDQADNHVVLSSSGIELRSPKNISIEADQTLTLKGNMGINIVSSAGDIKEKGINITANAQVQYSAQGSATAQVQGGAQLTLKGAMVMIN